MTTKLVLAGDTGTEIIESEFTAVDLIEGLPQPPTPAAELRWWDVLNEPVVQFRNGSYERFSRDDTHIRIGLLEDHLSRHHDLLANLEQQLVEATAVVEANAARLDRARAKVERLAYEAQTSTGLRVDYANKQSQALPMSHVAVYESVMLPQRRRILGQTQEWADYKQLEQRCRSDARSAEYQAIRRRSTLTERLTYERQLAGHIQGQLHQLRQNLTWHDEQEQRLDPTSATSVARQQLVDRLEADVRAGRISGYSFPGQ